MMSQTHDGTDDWEEGIAGDFEGGIDSEYERQQEHQRELEAAAEAAAELADQARRDGPGYTWGNARENNRRDRYEELRRRRDELQRGLYEARYERLADVIGGAEEEAEDEDDEIIGHVEAFIEAYDVPMKEIPKLTRILDKPHSERSDADKKLLKKIISKSRKKKPKVKIDRQRG